MKDFIDLIFTPDDGLELTLSIIMGILLLLISGVIGYGVFYLIDSSFLPEKRGVGKVSSMRFIPSHHTTTLVYNAATKTSMPMTVYHPDAWRISIDISGKSDSMNISETAYVKLHFGQQLNVIYTTGRFSDDVYIKSYTL